MHHELRGALTFGISTLYGIEKVVCLVEDIIEGLVMIAQGPVLI